MGQVRGADPQQQVVRGQCGAAPTAAADLIEQAGIADLALYPEPDEIVIQVPGASGDASSRTEKVARASSSEPGTVVQRHPAPATNHPPHPAPHRPLGELQVAIGDVADILPADLLPSRSLEADKAELTRIIESYAATGGIDRATGGHLLDEMIRSWHRDQVTEINRAFLTREATADHLVGSAEARHQHGVGRNTAETGHG